MRLQLVALSPPVTYDVCPVRSQLWMAERARAMSFDTLAWSRVSCLATLPCPIAFLLLSGQEEAGNGERDSKAEREERQGALLLPVAVNGAWRKAERMFA